MKNLHILVTVEDISVIPAFVRILLNILKEIYVTRGYGPFWPFCHAMFKIKCNVHLEIAKLMLKNISINVSFSRSFHFGTVVGESCWDYTFHDRLALYDKSRKNINLTQYLDTF